MKAVGWVVVLAVIVGGGIFVMNLLSGLAHDQCARLCPNNPSGVVRKIDVGPIHYDECTCK